MDGYVDGWLSGWVSSGTMRGNKPRAEAATHPHARDSYPGGHRQRQWPIRPLVRLSNLLFAMTIPPTNVVLPEALGTLSTAILAAR